MSAPSEPRQIEILLKLQQLVTEGAGAAKKSSTYKYALLLALANLAVERGDESGAPLMLSISAIAEQFVRLYWRQVIPYVPKKAEIAGGVILVADGEPGYRGAGRILRQAPGESAILNLVVRAHEAVEGSLAALLADARRRERLVRDVARIVRAMPLNFLQNVGGTTDEFLYERLAGAYSSITLKEGVAFTLRRFHGLLQELVRGAWARYVSSLGANRSILSNTEDLHEFLFGTERASLDVHREILRSVEGSNCFYCGSRLADLGHVDHFVPWSRYPVDLGHNFVIAHGGCNGDKSDLLASVEHLEHWVDRNRTLGAKLAAAYAAHDLIADLDVSRAVTHWAYELAARSGSRVWKARNTPPVALDAAWEKLLLKAR